MEDWATDFDHTSKVWAADPFSIWDRLRKECPIAHTDRFGGAWLLTRHEDIAALAYDCERFTSRGVVVADVKPPMALAPKGITPPITSDPPFHDIARRVLLPAFSPQAVRAMEADTRRHCEELVDGMRGRDLVDAADEYAKHIPVRVVARMLGFPDEDADLVRHFVDNVLENVTLPYGVRMANLSEVFDYVYQHVNAHLQQPQDDLTSRLLAARADGAPLALQDICGTMVLLLLAGIDTTWSAIGASLWHLGTHPADRDRLVAEPELLSSAVEEFLRAYAPVMMARLVREDMEWRGRHMRADDWVLVPFGAANRDPAVFADADQVIIDRKLNRHNAFGAGIHRCVGSHLARMEMKVALEVWLRAFPVFEVSGPVVWSTGQIRGPRTVPMTIGNP